MKEPFLGMELDLDESINRNEVVFASSYQQILDEMKSLGWSMQTDRVEPSEEDLRNLLPNTVTVKFEARLFKDGVERVKAEWDADMQRLLQGRVGKITNIGIK